jgi:hypothetical protein
MRVVMVAALFVVEQTRRHRNPPARFSCMSVLFLVFKEDLEEVRGALPVQFDTSALIDVEQIDQSVAGNGMARTYSSFLLQGPYGGTIGTKPFQPPEDRWFI